jgi:hypothetical protein
MLAAWRERHVQPSQAYPQLFDLDNVFSFVNNAYVNIHSRK